MIHLTAGEEANEGYILRAEGFQPFSLQPGQDYEGRKGSRGITVAVAAALAQALGLSFLLWIREGYLRPSQSLRRRMGGTAASPATSGDKQGSHSTHLGSHLSWRAHWPLGSLRALEDRQIQLGEGSPAPSLGSADSECHLEGVVRESTHRAGTLQPTPLLPQPTMLRSWGLWLPPHHPSPAYPL